MQVGRLWLAGVVAALALSVIAIGAPGSLARATKPKVVKVGNDYFSAGKVKVRKRGRVRWKWIPGAENHNVKLRKGPKGVSKRRFSTPQSSYNYPYTFTKRFKKPGRYQFWCTNHPGTMNMTVVVKR